MRRWITITLVVVSAIAACAGMLVYLNRAERPPTQHVSQADPKPERTFDLDQTSRSTNRKADPTAPSATPDRIPRVLDGSIAAFASRYAELATRAEGGDSDAAKELYRGLGPCLKVVRDRAALEKAIAFAEPANGDGGATRGSMTARFENCARLSESQLGAYRHWLSLASKAGDSEAKIDFITNGAPDEAVEGTRYREALDEYRERANAYLHEELSRANPQALLAAAHSYATGDLYRPDEIKLYAYLYAYTLAVPDHGAELGWLAQLDARMSEGNRARARAKGEEIFTPCCEARQ